MLMTAAGCSDNGGSSGAESTATSASSTSSQAGGETSAPAPSMPSGLSVLTSGTPLDTVVASVEGHEDMNVTFGDFLKEYKYRLAGYQITDDTNEMYASSLQSEREYIVNYLINEKIMYKKFEELGFSLTDEDNARIDADTEAGVESIKEALRQRISATELLEESELDKRVEEEYNKILADCGLTAEDIRNWQKAIAVQSKLTEYVNSEYVYDPTDTEEQIAALIKQAQDSYTSDPASYQPDAMASLWVPEGSRTIKQILVKFDDEAIEEITALRSEGKDADADALRTAKLEEMSDKINEVQGYVDEGQDFAELMSKYSNDGDTTMSYIICPETELYMEGFAETSFGIAEIGGTAVCITDYGWHLIKYIEEAVVTQDELQDYKESLHKYMEEQYISQNYGTAIKEWRAAYSFTIDRDTLLLAEENTDA